MKRSLMMKWWAIIVCLAFAFALTSFAITSGVATLEIYFVVGVVDAGILWIVVFLLDLYKT